MSDREAQIQKEMATCVHFNGIQNATCLAGVNYRELVGGKFQGWALAIPCLSGMFWRDGDRAVVPCDHITKPSRSEAEATVDADNAHVADVLRRLDAGEDVPGVIVCGQRTQPEGHECPASVDGKCSKCGAAVDWSYGLGSGYGGIGSYSYCTNEDCFTIHDFTPDDEDC